MDGGGIFDGAAAAHASRAWVGDDSATGERLLWPDAAATIPGELGTALFPAALWHAAPVQPAAIQHTGDVQPSATT